MTADGSVVILKAVAVGGSVTLVGRLAVAGEWQFARITVDQLEDLLGEAGVRAPDPPEPRPLEWVNGWDEAVSLLDRYPWARLHPVAAHPEFVERVRVAVDERLAGVPQGSDTERVRGKWGRLLGPCGKQSSDGEVLWQS
jgi:hypothetical protein